MSRSLEFLKFVFCVGIILAAGQAFAQTSGGSASSGNAGASASSKASAAEKDKRKTSIDFEDELIQGELKKPELFYLLQKKQFNFKRLIKLREDFLPEMRRTSQDIRRSGSGN